MGQEGAGPRTPATLSISTVTGNHREGGHRGLTPGHRGPRGLSGTGSGNRPDSGRCLFQQTGPLPHAIVPSPMFLKQDRSGRWIKGRRKPGPNWGAGAWGDCSGFACETGKRAIGDLMAVTGRGRPPCFCFLYFDDSTVRKIMSDFSLSISVKVWGRVVEGSCSESSE